MIKNLVLVVKFYCLIFVLGGMFSCNLDANKLTVRQVQWVKGDVKKLVDRTSRDIGRKGPAAWLSYFEDSPGFYMASNGIRVFPSYRSADNFITNHLSHQLKAINLKWSAINIRPLTTEYAIIGSSFQEDLTDFSGKTIHCDGYFTATAHRTRQGWKYLNVHWSIKT